MPLLAFPGAPKMSKPIYFLTDIVQILFPPFPPEILNNPPLTMDGVLVYNVTYDIVGNYPGYGNQFTLKLGVAETTLVAPADLRSYVPLTFTFPSGSTQTVANFQWVTRFVCSSSSFSERRPNLLRRRPA